MGFIKSVEDYESKRLEKKKNKIKEKITKYCGLHGVSASFRNEFNDDILVSLRYEHYIYLNGCPITEVTYRECYIADREIRNSSIRSIYISFKGYLKLAFGDVL